VREGDRIRIDVATRTMDLLVDEAELAARREGWAPLAPRYTRGVLAKYARTVAPRASGRPPRCEAGGSLAAADTTG
jgi:dihydroxy-acid dehydratase